jgi:hypothetical protein
MSQRLYLLLLSRGENIRRTVEWADDMVRSSYIISALACREVESHIVIDL